MALLSKVRSGVSGFDELVLGGLPRRQSVLLTGGTGTGKSTFAMQFIFKGASVYDEPGVYVTMEESASSILKTHRLSDGMWPLCKRKTKSPCLIFHLP